MRHAAVLLAALALAAPAAAAPAKKPDPKASAERFNLDLPADADATVTSPDAPAEPPAAPGGFTLDTPIAALLADYRSKAVLDKDMPGLSTDKNLDKFKGKSLRELAPLSGGRLTPELLEKVGKHLARLD